METLPRKERKENSCFDNSKRMILEGYLLGKTGFPKITNRTQHAEIFKCDRKTIYNEIKRGTVEHLQSDLSTIFEYNAEYAQNIAKQAYRRNAFSGHCGFNGLQCRLPLHRKAVQWKLGESKTRPEKATANLKTIEKIRQNIISLKERLERQKL